MRLPSYVKTCVDALEEKGYAAYLVGGCVRDACLGDEPHDYDLCTSALPEQTEAVFAAFPRTDQGRQHGTICVESQGQVLEITTFRTEGGYQDGRHPDWVKFMPDVESDLSRRDFTINAIAYSPTRGYADPFGGREDLKKGIVKAVGDPVLRFQEDALRILRCIRFAARYDFALDPETERAMYREAHRLDNLARERVFDELCRMLPGLTARQLLRFAPILARIIPELAPMIGFHQRSPHHAYDLMTHVAQVVEKVPAHLALRWAALLHDIGKIPTFTRDATGRGHFYGHAPKSAEMADAVLQRLRAPTALREQAVFLIENHMSPLVPEKAALRRQVSRWGWEKLEALLTLQQADMSSKGVPGEEGAELFAEIFRLLEEIRRENGPLSIKELAVNGHDLMGLGIRGRDLGNTLNALLEQVMEDRLPNEQAALLAAAGNMKEENHA